jgi:hypothetical protein
VTISTIRKFLGPRLSPLLFAGAVAIVAASPLNLAAAAEPTGQAKPSTSATPATPAAKPAPNRQPARQAARPQPIPQGCADMKGVERKICIECDGIAFFKRIGCQQRVFWTTCKGKRLFEDGYCQMHQEKGPPGESN